MTTGPSPLLDSFMASLGVARISHPPQITEWFATVGVVPAFLICLIRFFGQTAMTLARCLARPAVFGLIGVVWPDRGNTRRLGLSPQGPRENSPARSAGKEPRRPSRVRPVGTP